MHVTIETKEEMTDKFKLDVIRSEPHVADLQQILDHQDTINSLHGAVDCKHFDTASSVVSGNTTSGQNDNTAVAR